MNPDEDNDYAKFIANYPSAFASAVSTFNTLPSKYQWVDEDIVNRSFDTSVTENFAIRGEMLAVSDSFDQDTLDDTSKAFVKKALAVRLESVNSLYSSNSKDLGANVSTLSTAFTTNTKALATRVEDINAFYADNAAKLGPMFLHFHLPLHLIIKQLH